MVETIRFLQVITEYSPWLELFISISDGSDQDYLATVVNQNQAVFQYV